MSEEMPIAKFTIELGLSYVSFEFEFNGKYFSLSGDTGHIMEADRKNFLDAISQWQRSEVETIVSIETVESCDVLLTQQCGDDHANQ